MRRSGSRPRGHRRRLEAEARLRAARQDRVARLADRVQVQDRHLPREHHVGVGLGRPGGTPLGHVVSRDRERDPGTVAHDVLDQAEGAHEHVAHHAGDRDPVAPRTLAEFALEGLRHPRVKHLLLALRVHLALGGGKGRGAARIVRLDRHVIGCTRM